MSNEENKDLQREGLTDEEVKSFEYEGAPTAINANFKTRRDIEKEFIDKLGFDPTNLDELSQQMEVMDELSKSNVAQLIDLQQQMGDMLIARFNNNMEAFKKLLPSIYEQFKDYRPSEPIEFMCTSNGIPNLYFPDRNEFFYKVFDPVELCNKQVDLVLETCPFRQLNYGVDRERLGQIHHRYLNDIILYQKQTVPDVASPLLSNSSPICIMVGCGLGYQIGRLYERLDVGNLVLIEPNLDLFFASLHAFDWANLLNYISENNRGIYLMVGQTSKEVFEDLNQYYSRHGRMLACFMWSMVHYRSKEINEIADRIIEDYERTYATLGFYDDHLFGISHGMYHVTHGVHFAKNDVPIPEEFVNVPLCIVANGPSLSHDLPLLRKIQDKVIIIACGTAIETLYNAGIKPFFYGATERLRVVSEHLSLIPDKDFIRDCILVAGDVVHPAVIDFFDKTCVFGKADETFYWLAGAKIYEKMRKVAPISLMNPLVGNLGVAAATQFCFNNNYFFGLDNGTKREDKQTHPDENLFYKHTHKVQDIAMNALTYELDGNFGGKVQSTYLYRLSARYIEVIMRLGESRNIKYFNCSDGALLKGAEPTHFEDIVGEWEKLPDVDFDKLRKWFMEEKTFDLQVTEEEAKRLVDPETVNMVIDKLVSLLQRPERPKTRLEYVFLLQTVCEVIDQVRNTRDYYIADLLDGSLYGYFAMLMRPLYLIEDEQEAIEVTEECMKYVFYFLDDCKKLYEFLPYYYAEDHHKFLNGKVGFDHPDSKAPDLNPREPYVTEEDRKKYPNRKFVKRYE